MVAVNVKQVHNGNGYDVTGQLNVSAASYLTGGIAGVKAAILAKAPTIVGALDLLVLSGYAPNTANYDSLNDKLVVSVAATGAQVANAATLATGLAFPFFAKVR